MEGLSPDKLIKVYLKIKESRDALKTKFDEDVAKFDEQLKTVKEALLDHCREHNVESVKTPEGLFYRSVKRNYWTDDWDSLKEFVKENDCLDFFVKRLNQENVKTFLEENPDKLPKGLNARSEYTLTVRRPK